MQHKTGGFKLHDVFKTYNPLARGLHNVKLLNSYYMSCSAPNSAILLCEAHVQHHTAQREMKVDGQLKQCTKQQYTSFSFMNYLHSLSRLTVVLLD